MSWQSIIFRQDRPNPWGGSGGNSGGNKGGGSGNGRGPGGFGGGGNGRGPNDPDIEEMLRKGQEQFQKFLPGGRGPVIIALVLAALLWLSTGIYRVETSEQAVILRFGQFKTTTGAGFHVHLPYPIEEHIVRGVTQQNTTEVGGSSMRPKDAESLMLTGDENIVDVKFNVVWRINNLENYLFRLREPDQTVKSVAESVMRELVGKNPIVPIITTARNQLEQDTRTQIQETLDSYEAGIQVLRVQIIESQAPNGPNGTVKDAFLDVQKAEADQEKLVNEAQAYANKVVPDARGRAAEVIQQAEAYRARAVAEAQGEASRFLAIYGEYKEAKGIVRQRLYLQMMEEVLAGMDKTIVNEGNGVVPLLPLNEYTKGTARNRGDN